MKYIVCVVIFILFLLGCKGNQGPVGPAGTTLSGDIVGKTFLYADDGTLLKDNNGIKVLFEGNENYYSAITLSDGSWKIEGIPAGIYSFTFSKTGYSMVKFYSLQFVGGGTYYWGNIYLGQIPPVTITKFKFSGPDENNYFNIEGSISSSDFLPRPVEVIYDKEPILDSPTTSYLRAEYFNVDWDSTSFSKKLEEVEDFKKTYGLSHGEKIYLRLYILPRWGSSASYNPFSGKVEIYNSQNLMSKLDSIIVP